MDITKKIDILLSEITKVGEEEVEEIINAGEKTFKKALKLLKIKPSFLLLKVLSFSFKRFDISFYTFKEGKMAGLTSIEKGNIKIGLDKAEIKSLKKGLSPHIKKKLRFTLVHELIHRKQFGKQKRRVKDAEMKRSDLLHYFNDNFEIEAYARSAVYEIERDVTEVLMTYAIQVRPYDKKSWEKFLKKLYQYVDLYSEDKDKAKERIRSALEFSQALKGLGRRRKR